MLPLGAVSGDSKCLSILIINDNNLENDNSFQAQLVAFEPASVPVVLDDALANISIQDSDGERKLIKNSIHVCLV